MKQILFEEFRRMQKLAGLNEIEGMMDNPSGISNEEAINILRNKKPDYISMRLFLEELNQDPDDDLFSIAIEDGDIYEAIILLADVAGNSRKINSFDGIFTKEDFIRAAMAAQFSEEIIEAILNLNKVKFLKQR